MAYAETVKDFNEEVSLATAASLLKLTGRKHAPHGSALCVCLLLFRICLHSFLPIFLCPEKDFEARPIPNLIYPYFPSCLPSFPVGWLSSRA